MKAADPALDRYRALGRPPARRSPLKSLARVAFALSAVVLLPSQARAQTVDLIHTCCGVSGFNQLLPAGYTDSALAEPFVTDHAYYRLSSLEVVAVANWMGLYSDRPGAPGSQLAASSSLLEASTRDSVKFSLSGLPTVRPDSTYWLALAYRQTDGTTFGAGSVITVPDTTGQGAGFVAKFATTENFSAGDAAVWDVVEPMPRNVIPTALKAEKLGTAQNSPVPFETCLNILNKVNCSFLKPAAGFWFSAQAAASQRLVLSSGTLMSITAPTADAGYATFDLETEGTLVGNFNAGETFDFASHGLNGASAVTINAHPTLKPAALMGATALASNPPLGFEIEFQGQPDLLTFEADVSAVPEPAPMGLFSLGALALLAWRVRPRP